MRHQKNFNHLSRKAGHRRAMFANMASSLIKHKRIETTTAKAKALRSYVEPLISKSKDDSTHSRRVVFSYLNDKEAVTELFREVSLKVAGRQGGYTRILKTGNRLGDNADMCIIELVDYNENLLAAKEDKAASGKRRRRGAKKKGAETITTAENLTEQTEEVVTGEITETETKKAEEKIEKPKVKAADDAEVEAIKEKEQEETEESSDNQEEKKEGEPDKEDQK